MTASAGTESAGGVRVRLAHVSAGYSDVPVIQDVDLTLASGEFAGIVGPSGSGKTTLLRTVLGTLPVSFGQAFRAEGVRIGYVPQVESVDWSFPVTVGEVVLMTMPQRRWSPRATVAERRRVADLLERLGLDGLAGRHIRELSGGQQQRVFLARALAGRPDMLVLDEPTAGVDVRTRHEILHLLADINAEGVAVLLTTHDINGLAAHLPRLVCFNRTVVADGPPRAVLHPYVLERTFGAPMEVLEHEGMPVVLDAALGEVSRKLRRIA